MSFWLGKQPAGTESKHRWTVYVRGVDCEDLSYFVKKVVFTLHESFNEPIRNIEKPPYEVTEIGWGEFDIGIKIFFHDPKEAPQSLIHHLKLFPTLSVKKPVVSETLDEFVFVNPSEIMMKQLNSGTGFPSIDTGVNMHYMIAELRDQEQKSIETLRVAEAVVQNKMDILRKRLYAAEAETAKLRGNALASSAVQPMYPFSGGTQTYPVTTFSGTINNSPSVFTSGVNSSTSNGTLMLNQLGMSAANYGYGYGQVSYMTGANPSYTVSSSLPSTVTLATSSGGSVLPSGFSSMSTS